MAVKLVTEEYNFNECKHCNRTIIQTPAGWVHAAKAIRICRNRKSYAEPKEA